MLGENYFIHLILCRRELDKYKNIRFDKFKLIYRYYRNKLKKKIIYRLDLQKLEDLVNLYFILYKDYYKIEKNLENFNHDMIREHTLSILYPYNFVVNEIYMSISHQRNFSIKIYHDTLSEKTSLCNIDYYSSNHRYYITDDKYKEFVEGFLYSVVLDLSIKILERGEAYEIKK